MKARYVVGCDGARSAVRQSLGRALYGDSAAGVSSPSPVRKTRSPFPPASERSASFLPGPRNLPARNTRRAGPTSIP
uniref:FAD-dependent monooxygenase n=1 Tax=Aquibium pacificus TaxID=3153579 RepID=UPI0035A11FA0